VSPDELEVGSLYLAKVRETVDDADAWWLENGWLKDGLYLYVGPAVSPGTMHTSYNFLDPDGNRINLGEFSILNCIWPRNPKKKIKNGKQA
jgi:hypothetical protein